MKTFNKISLIRKNDKLRRNAEGNVLETEDRLRKRKMCVTCNFFIDDQCSKKRIIRKCAEQGLKNKE